MSQSQKMALKVQEKLVTRLFLSAKLRQNLTVLSYSSNDLKKVITDFSETNPFVSLKRPKNELQNLDWITSPDEENLLDHLLSQVRLADWDQRDKKIVIFLIYQLDSDGYLRIELSDLKQKTEFSLDQLKNTIDKLHHLDPLRIGAYNLNECLLIQAQTKENFNEVALDILKNNQLEKLADPQGWNNFKYSKEELLVALSAIRTLNPAPASAFDTSQAQYLIPDLRFEFEGEDLLVSSSNFDLPELVFNEQEFANMQKNSQGSDKQYFQKQKRDFTELKQAIAQREQTLIRLGKYIGKVQRKYLKSLDLQDLEILNLEQTARDLNLAISTVSRAIKDKYVECQGKIFSLKLLFPRKSVGKLTSQQVELLIEEQIKNEDKANPLSDDQLVANMQKNKINLSRRTVAKYRKCLGIKNSYQRKPAEN